MSRPQWASQWGSATGVSGLAGDFELDNTEYLSIDDGVQSGLDITGSLTLAGWVRAETIPGTMLLAAKYEYGVNNRGYRVNVESTGKLAFIVSPDGTYDTDDNKLVADTAMSTGTWYHVAAVFDASAQTMAIYLDGDLDGSRSVDYGQIYASTAPFMLGSNLNNGSPTQHFDGRLDEWRAYDRALKKVEIEALMVATPPDVSFGGSPLSGGAPLTVTLTHTTGGEVDSYLWAYGDGATSTTSAVTHTHAYTSAGVYTVSLAVTGPGGTNVLTRTSYVTVTSGGCVTPTAGFSGSPLSGTSPLTVTFTDVSTGTVDGRLWTFGDGGTSTATDPSHTYTQTGIFTVSLTVSATCGSDVLARTNYVTVSSGGGGYTTTTTVITYTYDPLNRLTDAEYSTGESFEYKYGAVGNREAMTTTAETVTYTYDAANRLTAVGEVSYTYDDNGNLTNDGVYTYTWNVAGRLVGAESVTHTMVYTYNGDGVRVAQSVDGQVTTWALTLASHCTSYNGLSNAGCGLPQVLVESTSGETTLYSYGLGRLAQEKGNDAEWFLGDALGSVRQLVDDDGDILLARDYTPFGQPLSESGTGSSGYGFTGEQQDTNTGLVFLRARYFDPMTGRFLSQDPWEGNYELPLTMNSYLYVIANP